MTTHGAIRRREEGGEVTMLVTISRVGVRNDSDPSVFKKYKRWYHKIMARTRIKIARQRLLVTGKVKGVGMRYHVLKLAEQIGVIGFVKNTPDGVLVEIEGESDALDSFVRALETDPPPFSKIGSIIVSDISLKGEKGFKVISS